MENTMEVTCSRSLALKEIGLSGYQYRIKIRSCFPFFFFFWDIRYIQENTQDSSVWFKQFWKTIHTCNHHLIESIEHFHHTRKFPHAAFRSVLHGNHHYNFYHHKLFLFVLKFYTNGSIWYIIFTVWLLSINIIFLRFINLLCITSLLLFHCWVVFHYVDIPHIV